MSLPSSVDLAVARRLFEDMKQLTWEGLTQAERSRQYATWISDPDVGGKLTQFMTAERARVWIKDGPVKEYPRALAGIGKYAALVKSPADTCGEIVRRALGPGWAAASDDVQIKPLRVVAYAENDEEAIVAWGPARDLKHLVWAALVSQAKGDARPWVLALTETFTRPTPSAQKALHLRVAKRAGLRIVHIEAP